MAGVITLHVLLDAFEKIARFNPGLTALVVQFLLGLEPRKQQHTPDCVSGVPSIVLMHPFCFVCSANAGAVAVLMDGAMGIGSCSCMCTQVPEAVVHKYRNSV
jgi:hypothetical protein